MTQERGPAPSPGPGTPGEPPPAPVGEPPAEAAPHKIERTRVSALNVAVVVGLVIAVFVLVFILQNLQDARIHYLGLSGRFPLGVGLLLAALAGALIVLIPMGVRIFQLRRAARHHRNEERRRR